MDPPNHHHVKGSDEYYLGEQEEDQGFLAYPAKQIREYKGGHYFGGEHEYLEVVVDAIFNAQLVNQVILKLDFLVWYQVHKEVDEEVEPEAGVCDGFEAGNEIPKEREVLLVVL